MNNSQFSLQLCMITALAFVPLQDVVNSIDKLCVVIQNQYNELTILKMVTLAVFAGMPPPPPPPPALHFIS